MGISFVYPQSIGPVILNCLVAMNTDTLIELNLLKLPVKFSLEAVGDDETTRSPRGLRQTLETPWEHKLV